MKVSEAWLREWVNPAWSTQELADQLTMIGLEVDALTPVAGDFSHVVIAHVLQTTPHPQADKLTLCQVDAGSDSTVQIVCGASNVRSGLRVALALPGASLPSGIVIKESMLRGQLSQGMLCSVSELGMDERSDGIIELPEDAPTGQDLRDYLSLNDQVYDINLTPNRADCFSILGIARDVSALSRLSLTPVNFPLIHPEIDASIIIHIDAPEACPRYCARVIRGINPDANTPIWMKERLRRSGIRAIHPVVDVINYVMIELGQPMHAFDLQQIEGDLHIRYAHLDEKLVLLDGQEINLQDKVLIIADDQSPLAIAGVMGGEASAVKPITVDILLESAFFNPLVISGVARSYGLSSDSSQRFERGVDPELPLLALARATELLQSIVGGQAGPVSEHSLEKLLPVRKDILFNPMKVKQLTGVDVSLGDMEQMLQSLGMSVSKQADIWTVAIPSYRFDIALDVDLVEEIIRLHGYNNIIAAPVMASLRVGDTHSTEHLSRLLSAFFSARAYRETISYSFVDPQFQQALYPNEQTMELLNPISSELSEMRVGLWSGLLASMIYNINRQQTGIKFFEAGVVFNVCDKLLSERPFFSGLITGERAGLNWSEASGAFDFFDMKGDLQALFASLNIPDVKFITSSAHPALHPGQAAQIMIGHQDAGWIGVLHPRLLNELGLNTDVILFELSLPVLLSSHNIHFQRISKYPQIRRDLSLLVDHTIKADQIEQAVREVVPSHWLKGFDIFDLYTGNSIPEGKKSLAVALTLQDDTRTLVDSEIADVINLVIKKLNEELTITIRDVTN